MNILYVNSCFEGGGAEKIARQLYIGVKEYSEINTFFLAGRQGKEREIDCVYDEKIPLIYKRSINLLTNNSRKHDFLFVNKIERIITEKKIDIIHFHNIHGNYMGIEDIIKLSSKCKILWTLHDMWAITGHCAQVCGCDRWYTTECRKCQNLDFYPKMFFDEAAKYYQVKKKAFTNKNITFIVPSVWLKEQCNKSFLCNEKVEVIHNGVDINAFFPMDKKYAKKKMGISQEKIAIMFVSNNLNDEYKGFNILLEALNMINTPEWFELIVVGNGIDIQISNSFKYHYLGYIDNDKKLNEVYNSADVFILPSIAENFPCTILESMAAGTPVIASNIGGIPEQIDMNTGWLFDVGDVKTLKKIIEMLPKEKDILKKKGSESRKKIENTFSERKMFDRYIDEYIKINNLQR